MSDIDEALEAISKAQDVVAGMCAEDHWHISPRTAILGEALKQSKEALERQRDENRTLRGLLDALLSATESERKVRRIAAKYGIDAVPEVDDGLP